MRVRYALALALSLAPQGLRAEVTMKSGVFSQKFIDALQEGGLKYPITRTYNSKYGYRGLFGHRWLSELETVLRVDSEGRITISESGGGAKNEFTATGPGHYQSATFAGQKLTRDKTGYVRFRLDGSSEYFSASGKLVRVLDGANYIDFRYDRNGHLESLTDNQNRKFVFTTNTRGLVTRIQSPRDMGKSKGYASYEYDPEDQLTRSKDEKGNVYYYKYTADGRHLLTEIAYVDKTTFQISYYDSSGFDNVKSFKDRKGETTAYVYEFDPKDKNHMKAMAHTTGPFGQHLSEITFEYFSKLHSNGESWLYRLISTEDGKRTETTFDEVTGKPVQSRDEVALSSTEEAALREFLPAVIRVETIGRGCVSGGTGFFISPDGIAVTNRHVLEPALRSRDCRVRVTQPGKAPLKRSWAALNKSQLRHTLEEGARVTEQIRIISCGTSKGRDLCLFKINADPERNFRVDSRFPKEGTPIFTIGNPMNEGLMIDSGQYLGRANHSGVSQVTISILTRGGNSGGPIFTSHGQLIGLHSTQYTYSGAYAGKGISNSRTEQAGISAFEIAQMLDAYSSAPKTYSLEEFRERKVPGITW